MHFAAIMVVNLSAGCLTPYASVLYFGMKIGNASFGEMMKNTAVFLVVGYLPVVLLTTYIEPISMTLPSYGISIVLEQKEEEWLQVYSKL